MSKETLLKKEFNKADVQRARNLVNKDYTSKTKDQAGYTKAYIHRKEGDIWEESGKTWTIKNGIKQNLTKLDSAKEIIKIPLCCPKCENRMKKRLDSKMFKVHGFCFDCVIDYEADLQKAGLYEQYEKRMMSGNIKAFMVDIEAWITESLEDNITLVTEQGDVESWGGMSNTYKDKIREDLQKYLQILKEHVT